VSWLNDAVLRDPGDDGAADPGVAAALAAFAAGEGGEHAALTALAGSRLLVPLVALPPDAEPQDAEPQDAESQDAAGEGKPGAAEMVLPTLVGNDGRPAVLAFTGVDSLTRWRRDARPVPVPAAQVWLAGAQEASAVVIDVAGPVPLAVDGSRLAALAGGQPAPPPHEDPEVAAAARAAAAGEPLISELSLAPGGNGSDVALRVTLAADCSPARPDAQDAIRRVARTLMTGAGDRLRRGVEVTITADGAP
jgi:hypothetical protein